MHLKYTWGNNILYFCQNNALRRIRTKQKLFRLILNFAVVKVRQFEDRIFTKVWQFIHTILVLRELCVFFNRVRLKLFQEMYCISLVWQSFETKDKYFGGNCLFIPFTPHVKYIISSKRNLNFCCYSTIVGENFKSCTSQIPRNASESSEYVEISE